MNKSDHLHPERWSSANQKQHTNAILENGEEISSLLFMEAIGNTPNESEMYLLFLTFNTKETAMGRFVFHHIPSNETRVTDLIEYPVEDHAELIQEFQEHTTELVMAIMNDPTAPMKLNMDKPTLIIACRNASTKALIEKMEEETDPLKIEALDKVKKLLFKKETKKPVIGFKTNHKTYTKPVLVIDEAKLVKKYGLKNMQKLAKDMNYHGLLINKTKNNKKSHVTN